MTATLKTLVCDYYRLLGEARYNRQLAAESKSWSRPADAEQQIVLSDGLSAQAEKVLAELITLRPTLDEVFALASDLDAAGQTSDNQYFLWAVSDACFRGDAKVPPHARKHFRGLKFCAEAQDRIAK